MVSFIITQAKRSNVAPPALASLLNAQPRTKPDLDALSKEIMSAIISRYQSNPLYAYFVETFAKDLCETLASKDVRKVASGLTVLGNTKQTEERDKASGKKKVSWLSHSQLAADSRNRLPRSPSSEPPKLWPSGKRTRHCTMTRSTTMISCR